jgi:HAE1 family hydrophobic/amphiphilic exporter-1
VGILEQLVRRHVLTTVLVLIAVILGALSYAGLGLRRFPEIDFPMATVVTRYPGGSPSEIESDITKPIEDAVSSISGVEEIMSYSQPGVSNVIVQFALEEDIDLRAMDITSQVDMVRPLLPDGAEDPLVLKFSITNFPLATLALTGPQGAAELYRLADEELVTLLSQVSGVADVDVTGGQRRQIHVLLDAVKLRKHGLSAGSVAAALQMANLDVPAGHITEPGRRYTIRATGRFGSLDEIRRVRVPTAGRGVVTVGDVADVRDAFEERLSSSRFNGGDAIILSVRPQSDANEVEVVDRVREQLPRLRGLLPPGAALVFAEDTSTYVRGALANVRSNMMIGIALTAVVLYLFLKSWRATFIAAVVMPTAVIVSFVGFRAAGFTLNILTLTGLAIVIGVLVNNAILVLENVTRLVHEGLDATEAAVTGTGEIALAILSSTATNLVVFLPIAFMGEIIGQFFRELGLTVVFATVVSLLTSYSLTPMMCGLMLREGQGAGTVTGRILGRARDATVGLLADAWRAGFERLKRAYLGALEWCLSHRWLTLLLTGLLFAASVKGFALVGGEFFPRSDEGVFRITVLGPAGTPLELTDEAVRRIESHVAEVPHLVSYYSRVGQVGGMLGGSSEGVHLAEITVTVTDRADRPLSVDDLMNRLRPVLATVPTFRVSVQVSEHGPGGSPVEAQISGDDMDAIQRTAERVLAVIKTTEGTAEVSTSWQAGQPELRLLPRWDSLNRHEVAFGTLAQDVRTYVEGRTVTQYRDADENYDVVLRLREDDRQWTADVGRLPILAGPGRGSLQVNRLAEVVEDQSPNMIMRKDRQRLLTVSADLTGERSLTEVLGEIRSRVDSEVDLPPGVKVGFGGEAEMMQSNFRELFKAIGTAAVLTFLCVSGIIESFSFAVVIIMSLPVCLIGVVAAMLIGGVGVNIFSLMAMVILVGMVVNNAIIVVDYAMRQERGGQSPREAVRSACSIRFRMILMANLTTVVALTPLSLGMGFAGEIFQPLAIVQMGGILAAAFLSLLVIPVIYVLVRGRKPAGPPQGVAQDAAVLWPDVPPAT